MITCRDILNLKLDGMTLIGGREGLNRGVSWTYLCQTKPYEDHMNPGNFALIVIDDIRFNIDEAYQAMNELYELGISGLAISIIEDREKVPGYFITRADVLKLPLFYIRWEGATFVDIDQSVAKLLSEKDAYQRRTSDYLYNLLFGYDINEKYLEKISGQFGLDFSVPHRVGIIAIDRTYGVNLDQDEHLYEFYINILSHKLLQMKNKPLMLTFLNKVVILFEATKEKNAEHEIEKILREIDRMESFAKHIQGTCILGRATTNPREYGKSYAEAKNLIPKKDLLPNPKHKKVLSASAAGIYKFMFHDQNQAEVLDYCDEKLTKLEEYDHANGTFLVDTVLTYYMCGFNLTRAAEELFIHRNSLQYRLTKIKELTGMELDDYVEYLDLINCIMVKKLMYL